MPAPFANTKQDFWDRLERQPNGCWNYPGANGSYGYFSNTFSDESIAHRVAWELANGPIPEGLLVLHKNECHNRSCCNPDHLYLGTYKDNARDALELGTQTGAVNARKMGLANRGRSLTEEHKAKINPKGQKRSEATKRKMSESAKKSVRKRKRNAKGQLI